MIRSIYRDALGTIRNAEQKISFEPAAIIEESYHMTTVLRGLLSQMKSHVLEKGFADDNEEIEFFKTIKPQILGKLIYYNKVFRIEASCPVGGGTLYHKYFAGELHQLKQEYKEHICNTDFYRYYRLGRTDWDHHFFQLGKIDLHSGVNSFVFEIDTQFSTYYDYKVARIIANELLYNYLLSKISPEEPEGLFFAEENGNAKDILWTDSKSALIELIYALHASGSISNGKGELIFRYIYNYLKCSKPFERLWISSLTEKAIRQGFEKLKPGTAFDGLFQSAQARSRADWLVGINASQALTLAAGNGIYSLGRVQTPTLALICKRYLENKDFSIKKYWQIQLSHSKGFISFKSISPIKWEDPKRADAALKAIQRSGTATVVSVETKNVSEQPPLLFDLTGLQKEANKKLNLSADETLSVAQSLYEKKFISYPRTGSKYIPEDMWAEIPNLVRALQDKENCKSALSKMKWGRFNKRIVNDLRVTDHHGLLVTDKIPSALAAKENAVYDLIAFRLLETLSQACIKEITDVNLQVSHHDFTAKGCKVLEAGWRSIKGNFYDDDAEILQDLPELNKDDELKITDASLLEKKTRPPFLYTEAGLLSAMESAGKEIENEDERKALQHIGIGTPATRASIIETLFARNYIQREKKSLIPTDKGLQVYELVKGRKIADVAMTAEWELALQKIENNEADAEVFQREMEAYASSIANELLEASIAQNSLPKLICPKCKSQQLIIRDKIVKCTSEICNWVQFRNVCGVQISLSDIESLVNKGKTSLITGMTSRAGKKFDAYIALDEDCKTSFEFEKSKYGKK